MVAVLDGVLIPRPETEAVVDMVATTDCERASWSYPSSSSTFGTSTSSFARFLCILLGDLVVGFILVLIPFADLDQRGMEDQAGRGPHRPPKGKAQAK